EVGAPNRRTDLFPCGASWCERRPYAGTGPARTRRAAVSRGRSMSGGRLTFNEMNLAEPLRRAVNEQGWTTPTPIQSKAIGPAREGRDVVGIAQTGTGKTAAFLLPSLEKQLDREGLHTLVLCPTRELADQVMEDAKELTKYTELFCGVVVGGMPMRPQIRDLR